MEALGQKVESKTVLSEFGHRAQACLCRCLFGLHLKIHLFKSSFTLYLPIDRVNLEGIEGLESGRQIIPGV